MWQTTGPEQTEALSRQAVDRRTEAQCGGTACGSDVCGKVDRHSVRQQQHRQHWPAAQQSWLRRHLLPCVRLSPSRLHEWTSGELRERCTPDRPTTGSVVRSGPVRSHPLLLPLTLTHTVTPSAFSHSGSESSDSSDSPPSTRTAVDWCCCLDVTSLQPLRCTASPHTGTTFLPSAVTSHTQLLAWLVRCTALSQQQPNSADWALSLPHLPHAFAHDTANQRAAGFPPFFRCARHACVAFHLPLSHAAARANSRIVPCCRDG